MRTSFDVWKWYRILHDLDKYIFSMSKNNFLSGALGSVYKSPNIWKCNIKPQNIITQSKQFTSTEQTDSYEAMEYRNTKSFVTELMWYMIQVIPLCSLHWLVGELIVFAHWHWTLISISIATQWTDGCFTQAIASELLVIHIWICELGQHFIRKWLVVWVPFY